jgi:hypothetical protein
MDDVRWEEVMMLTRYIGGDNLGYSGVYGMTQTASTWMTVRHRIKIRCENKKYEIANVMILGLEHSYLMCQGSAACSAFRFRRRQYSFLVVPDSHNVEHGHRPFPIETSGIHSPSFQTVIKVTFPVFLEFPSSPLHRLFNPSQPSLQTRVSVIGDIPHKHV